MDRLNKKPNSGSKARRLFFFLTALSLCVFVSLSVCNSALAENSEVVADPGLPYPRIANYYLLGSVDPAVYDDLAKYDLVILGTIWTEEQLNELRLRNPNIKILMYVCAYAMAVPPYSANTWETENYNYANDNNLWWRNRNGYIASDWPGAQMINVTSVAPRQGPQGTWRQYIINRVQDLVAARPSLDGIFFDNFWQSISWNQGNLQLDSNEDGYMDTNSQLDAWWQEAMTDIASQTRSLFDLAEQNRPSPLSIMGNGAGQYETWINGSMFEQFPWVPGMNEGNPYQYVWNYLMFHVPGGYLEGNFRPDPYNTTIIAAEWNRAIDRGPVRNADFERNKRFTIASALMGDGYYALDGNRNGGGHGDLWWEPEYDHDGRQRGYLGYPTGPMYRVANPAGPEIILNGSFSDGLNNWLTQFYNGSQGTVDIDSAEFHSEPASLRVNVTAAPPDSYVKITQSPVNVTYNTNYTLSFWARSSINQELLLHLYSPSCPGYRCLNDTRYNLTNEWTLYETSFTSTGTAGSGLDIFVLNPSTVWIDDISLREGDSSFYRRDFDNGLVLLNYTDTAQTISLGENYQRLSVSGSDVWDGAIISSETVPPYDARILLKANHPPELNFISDYTINEDQELIFNVTATDPDERDTLTYSVSGLPDWASFDTDTGLFRGTPGYNDARDYSLAFTVTDAGGLTDAESTIITVNNVNRPPVLPFIRDITMYEGQPLTIDLNGSDPDGDPITYLANPLPDGADLNPNSGVFNWTPDFDQAGIYPVTFTVSDGSLAVSQSTTITVINVNRAPVLIPTEDKIVNEGELLTFTLDVYDPDRDPLSIYTSILPEGASFDEATRTFSWRPNFNQSRTSPYIVTFSVSDRQTAVSDIVIINVIDVLLPDAPTGISAAVNYNNGIYIGLFWQEVNEPLLLGYNVYPVNTQTGEIGAIPINAAPLTQIFYSFPVNESILYQFVLTTLTIDGRESLPSEIVSIYADSLAPAGITDLRVIDRTDTSITLSWTATGDDGNAGQAISYDLRYANIPLADNLSRWSINGIQVQNEPVTAVSGTVETLTIINLLPNTIYYFSLRVFDDNGNGSSISNEVMVTTLAKNNKPFDGGGSGGNSGGGKGKGTVKKQAVTSEQPAPSGLIDSASADTVVTSTEVVYDKSDIMKSVMRKATGKSVILSIK